MSAAVAERASAEDAPLEALAFVLEAIEAAGALVERHDARAVAVLPPALAARLELPEESQLALYPSAKADIACGLGTPLLERLVTDARAHVPAASVQLDVDAPRPASARAIAERFVLRNGLADVLQVLPGTAIYVAASIAYVAEADDRREGIVRVVTDEHGGEPDAAVGAALDLAWPNATVRPSPSPLAAPAAARWIAARAEAAVRRAIEPIAADVARRHARDHERIAAYFADLVAEARAPRRRADPQAVDAKVAHLLAERDTKLRDLTARFALRVTSSPGAIVVAEVPTVLVSMRLRRRKASRDIVLRIPAGATAVDKLACEGCGAATARPAACDDRLHLLCEACAPTAQGRIACRGCGTRR